MLWVGTNDGNVQVSRDGGATWKNVGDKIPGAPKEAHISRVEASHFEAGTAYVTIDNHRLDDHKPYVFKTTDFGETWTSIAANLPEGNVNVIREDPKNRNLLYLGTEYGVYVSLDGGSEWKEFMNGLPYVRIDDILVHPRDNDLIVGTHGRSIWIIDDITPLQQLSGPGDRRRDPRLRRPAGDRLRHRHAAVDLGRERQALPRRQPAGGHRDQLLPEDPGRGRRADHDQRHHGPRTPVDRRVRRIAGLHRVQWTLTAGAPAGGRGQRGGAPQAAPPGTAATPATRGGRRADAQAGREHGHGAARPRRPSRSRPPADAADAGAAARRCRPAPTS